MGRAKDIRVSPISVVDARKLVKAYHYSGKVDPRSQLHFGIFLDGRCGGAVSLGPPIDKRRALHIVPGTPWNAMLDMHRMALADWLPRNSESRAIGVMMRLIRRAYPHIQWVQSYADGTQCGDGTIYRAAGFSLVGMRPNQMMYRMPDGEVCAKILFEPGFGGSTSGGVKSVKHRYGKTGSENGLRFLRRIGAECLPGWQLRYIFFLDPAARERLAVPIIPFSKIDEIGASMYRGQKRAGSKAIVAPPNHGGEGGETPTPALPVPPTSEV